MMADAVDAGKHRKEKASKIESVRAQAIKMGVLTHEVDEGCKCKNCEDRCPGFSLHFWRKVCKNCLCPREDHDIKPMLERQVTVGKLLFAANADTLIREHGYNSPRRRRVLELQRDSLAPSPSLLRKENYTWIPKDAAIDVARKYLEALPDSKKPLRDTPGERYWQRQKIKQLPAHDIDLLFCNVLTDEECKQMDVFLKLRKEKFLGRGELSQRTDRNTNSRSWFCERCKGQIKLGQVAVVADRVGLDKCWHPGCFQCDVCHELLIELIYFAFQGKTYCGRHHSEQLKPRCAACDEILFCKEYTRAEDQNWHVDHFCCLRCDTQLAGRKYMPRDGQPYCLNCYEELFSTTCETCGKTIALKDPRLSYEERDWHARPECFKCAVCDKGLIDETFLPKYNKIFCSKECIRSYRHKMKEHLT